MGKCQAYSEYENKLLKKIQEGQSHPLLIDKDAAIE